MINENFVFVGVALQAIGGAGYFLDTLKGRVKPNKVSWFLWMLAPLIAFSAMISQGVGVLALTTFISGFVPLLVFIASFFNKNSSWVLSKFDFVCGSLSLLGLALWLITKVGNIAIFFSIFADGLASIPTIVKSYKEPETESDLVYLMAVINSGIALLTINIWKFENYGFPLYLFILDILLVVLIRFKLGKFISNFRK